MRWACAPLSRTDPAFDPPSSSHVTRVPQTDTPRYSIWIGGRVYLSNDAAGPFKELEGFSYPGTNPAPLWHDGAFYMAKQQTRAVYTTPQLVAGANWTEYAGSGFGPHWHPLPADSRGDAPTHLVAELLDGRAPPDKDRVSVYNHGCVQH